MKSTSESTFEDDINVGVPVLVDFWAPWCGSCRALSTHLEQLAVEFEGRLQILKLNIDDWPGATARFGIRAVPTLIFNVNGQERDRLTGPSVSRLRVMIEKWLVEMGIELSGQVRTSESNPINVSGSVRRWVAFNGKGDVKEAALLRWANITKPEGRHFPSAVLPGERGDFEGVLGMPLSFAATLDGLWMLQPRSAEGFEVAHRAIRNLVESVPAGADVSAIAGLAVYEVAYDSPFNVTQYFTGDRCGGLLERIKGLHERERAHEIVSDAEWPPLKKEAIVCSELPMAGGSELLEELAGPLSSHPAEILGRLLMLARSDLRRFPGWSERDAARLDEIRMADSAHIKSLLGPRPSEQGPELGRWFRNAEDIQKELTELREREEPEFCARWTRWSNMQLQLRIDFLKSVSVIVQNHIDHVCGSL